MNKFLALLVSTLFLSLSSEAQRPEPIKPKQGNVENGNLQIDLSKIKIADTTNIKLNKLVNEFNIMKVENKKLKEDVQELKIISTSLAMKASEVQKDIVALKSQMQVADKSLADLKKLKPVAYGVLEPKKDPATGEIRYKLTNSYGIDGEVLQNIGGYLSISINHKIVGEPIIITSRGTNDFNGDDKRNAVLYSQTTDPKTFYFELYPPAVYPISFIIYEIGK